MRTESRKRRNYTEDFNRDAVTLVTEQGYKVSEVVRSLDAGNNLIRRWKRKFEEEAPGARLFGSARSVGINALPVLCKSWHCPPLIPGVIVD
jgi:transposase-like protein